jgi:uncharacterized repeat protein (TIGR01451 family)
MAWILVAVAAGVALTAALLFSLGVMSARAQAAPSAASGPPAVAAEASRLSTDVQPIQECHVITFQQGVDGYVGCRDTRITAERPHENYCDDELVLGMKGDGRVLVQFGDLERSMPHNARIMEGTLGLYVYNYGQRTVPIPLYAYSVIRPWKECEATWHKASYFELWGKPGCDDGGSDRSSVALDHTWIYRYDQWYEWEVTSAVADWLRYPLENRGLILVPITEDPGEYDIWHSEYVGPYLRVEYCLGPDVGVSKELTSPAGGQPVDGDTVRFTISVVNTGTTALTDVTLTDTFDPQHLSYVTASVPAVQTAPGTLTWTDEELVAFLPLASSDSFSVTIEFRTLKPISETSNCVLTEGSDQHGSQLLPREACAATEIRPQPPALSLTKQVTHPRGGTVEVGELLTFTVQIANTGRNALVELVVTDTYNSEFLSFVSASVTPSEEELGLLVWSPEQLDAYLPLAPGEDLEFTLVFRALGETPSARNSVTVEGTDEYGQQTPPEVDSDAVQLVPEVTLEITKELVSPSSGIADMGQTVRFKLGIKNVGSEPITSVTAVDRYDSSYLSPLLPWTIEPDDWMPGVITWTWEASDPFLPLAPEDSFEWTVDFVALAPVSLARNCLTVDGVEACDRVGILQPHRFRIYLPRVVGAIH